MPSEYISYRSTGYFSGLICDYLDQDDRLSEFYNRFPESSNFEAQIQEKTKNFSLETRAVLSQSLIEQYSHFAPSEATLSNIENLKNETTFTITTGHQLNFCLLYTSPSPRDQRGSRMPSSA